MGIVQKIYDKMPYFFQSTLFNIYCMNLHKKRFVDMFFTLTKELEASQWYSESDLILYQNYQVASLVKHAYETVPYYSDLMRKMKLAPEDITTVNDLPKLPVLTREDVIINASKLLSSSFKRKNLIHGHTSGTTGSPLNFYWDRNMWILNNVFDWRQKKWAGLNLGDPYCVLLGRPIVAIDRVKPPFWQLNRYENQLWMSSFHLSPKNVEDYYNKIASYSPKLIEGYPSTLYVLSKLFNDECRSVQLVATLSSSETLFDYQKDMVRSVFKCENFDFYGLAERVIWATECEAHVGKHLNMEYGVTEIVDNDCNPLPKGKEGFLVGTSLHNYGMPFIRYKTTDISSISSEECSCGRKMPLMGNVTTKMEDLILTPSGKYISSSVLTHPFKPLKNIAYSQIIQKKINLVVVKIVKRQGYNTQDTKNLLKEFSNRVGPDIEVQVEIVDNIPREKSGKFRWIISELNNTEVK